MAYQGINSEQFEHDSGDAMGVLLVNLGTPDSPTPKDVRRYLKEFLWDPRVVEMARPAWWLVLNAIILNTRPRRSAAAYAKVWTEQGSPLMVASERQAMALQGRLNQSLPGPVHLELAMRYGNPSIETGLLALRDKNVRRLLVLPLYPQYSATTTAAVFDKVTEVLRGWRWIPETRFVNNYHRHRGYIAALADSVREYQAQHGKPGRLVMSFHGIPHEYFLAGDPYHCECQVTGRLLAEALGLQDDEWQLTFQSRLGPKQWLKPYTDETLRTLGKGGVKSVQVICPGFSADCIETLEEINMENRAEFLSAGGEQFGYIACLNDRPAHMDTLLDIIRDHAMGWPEHDGGGRDTEALGRTLARAREMGATR